MVEMAKSTSRIFQYKNDTSVVSTPFYVSSVIYQSANMTLANKPYYAIYWNPPIVSFDYYTNNANL